MADRGGRGDLIQQLRGNESPTGHYKTLLPTPTAGDASASGSRNTATSKAHPGISLTDWAIGDGGNCADYSDGSRGKSPQLRHLGKGRLNPRFVEWMMDYPPGWTDLEGLDG